VNRLKEEDIKTGSTGQLCNPFLLAYGYIDVWFPHLGLPFIQNNLWLRNSDQQNCAYNLHTSTLCG
jgi:hypothetical protein